MRLGVVGGTYDPVHLGHIAMAEAAAACSHLDLVLLIPSATPPHRGAARAAAWQRLEMCRLATAGHPLLQVSDLEVVRGGPSYTADTLLELRRLHPGDDLHLILGWDAARELDSWHRPEEVLRLARLLVVSRPGLPDPTRAMLLATGIDPGRVDLCPTRTPAVGATGIRERLAAGQSVDGMLDPAVAGYIAKHGLYSSPERA